MTDNDIVSSELYVDVNKKSYDDLGFMRFGYLSLAASLLSTKILENGKKVCLTCLPAGLEFKNAQVHS